MPNRNRRQQRQGSQEVYDRRQPRQPEQYRQYGEDQFDDPRTGARRDFAPTHEEEVYPLDRRADRRRERDYGRESMAARDEYDPLGDYDRASDAARAQRPGSYNPQHTQPHSSFRADDFGGEDYTRSGYSGGGTRPSRMGGYAGSGAGFGGGYGRNDDRGFFDRAGDAVASWFGDENASRRRKMDHRGRGPANYRRSDERLLEDSCERLTQDPYVDATNITVTVAESEVTLDGTVSSRGAKRRAEDCIDDITGVKHIQNNLRVVENETNRNDTTIEN